MKMGTRTQNVKRNIVWGVLSKFVTIIIPFATRTVMIYQMGMNYVGLGSLFTSLLSVLSLTELGIGSALIFSMYEPINNQDADKVCALLNFYKKCYRIIGLIIFLLGLSMLPFLNYFVEGDIPEDIDLEILFCVYLLNTVSGYFLFAYKSSLFSAAQRTDLSSKVTIILDMLSGGAQIFLLLFFHNYYLYIIVLPVITCLKNLCIAVLTKKIYPQYVCRGSLTREELQEIKDRVVGLVFQKIGGIVLTSVDSIVISAFLGLRILGIYNGYYYIITSLFGFLLTIQQSLIPSVGNSIVKESKEKNYNDFRKFHFMYMWIVSWWSVCLLCLYQPFIRIWQGTENMFSFDMIILFMIYFYSHKMGDLCYVYREAAGMWWQGRFVPLIAAVLNLILNLILVNLIGLSGIVISTIASIVFVYTPYGSWVLFKYFFHSTQEWIQYLKRLCCYFIITCVIACGTWSICTWVSGNGFVALFIKGIICIFVPNILLLLIYWKNKDFQSTLIFVSKLIPDKLKLQFHKKDIDKK